MAEKTAAPKKRFIFIDVFRGISVLFMLEAHVMDALVYPLNKTGIIYKILNLTNGFVSVSFLFCAGAAFWIASMRKTDDYRNFRKPLFTYLKRLGFVLALAYWLHMPYASLSRSLSMTYDEFLRLTQCDVLHTIVISSLIALIILLIFPRPKILPYIYLALGAAIFYMTPFIWQYDAMGNLPHVINSYFARQPISKFPLFPWSGYFFAGITAAAIFSNAVDKSKTMTYMLFGGLAISGAALAISYIPFDYPGWNDWWYSSPGHAWFRLGLPVAVFALLFLLENRFKEGRIGTFLKISGQESLFIYAGHLVIVYGSVVSIGMKTIIGARLNLVEMFIIIIALATLFYSLAVVWNGLKTEEPAKARFITYSLSILFIIIFLVNPL